ncbi:hypothetical protein KHA94_23110 [Bacillus sp. FJAT-49705]|uniref:Uncharacterized protein n=1 Tax=Cytobacillus citreus TaxID=2833586 RepID=A0ABS5NYU3_9BACI|nr:hypothetical protein [Cytobacillus citreus]MBS4193006.1 hypothetical protein [Cytobacillus citreus]
MGDKINQRMIREDSYEVFAFKNNGNEKINLFVLLNKKSDEDMCKIIKATLVHPRILTGVNHFIMATS